VQYKFIENEQTEEIANFAVCLTNEIIERTGTKDSDVDTPLAIEFCKNHVSNGLDNVIAGT